MLLDSTASFIDIRDIAAVAEYLLALKENTSADYKGFTLTGAEALACYEVADILSQILNRRITYVDIPEHAARQGMKLMGMVDMLIDAILDLYRITREGHAQQIANTVKEMIGKQQPHSFTEFANDYSSSLK